MKKTYKNKKIDMDRLIAKNPHVKAVGNANMNARGDILNSKNEVSVSVEELDKNTNKQEENINNQQESVVNENVKNIEKIIKKTNKTTGEEYHEIHYDNDEIETKKIDKKDKKKT